MPAIWSRLTEISFKVPPEDREEVHKRLMERYENMLSANGSTFDKVRLEQIIEANFPDYAQSPIVSNLSLREQVIGTKCDTS